MRDGPLVKGEKRFSCFMVGAVALHAAIGLLVVPTLEPGQASVGERNWVPVEFDLASSAASVLMPAPAPADPRPSLGDARELGQEPSASQAQRRSARAGPQSSSQDPVAVVTQETEPVTLTRDAEPDDRGPAQSHQLGLDELGLGARRPVFPPFKLGPRRAPRERGRTGPLPQAQAAARLQQDMAQKRLQRDQRLGLGPEGPVLRQVVQLSRAMTSAANTAARLDVVTNADGAVVEVRLVDSTTDPRAWTRIASKLLAQLERTRLRAAGQGRGATFRIKVSVRAQLPSGADPGVAVNVAGLNLKEGAGSRSTRVDILHVDPKAILDPERGGVVSILSVHGDLVDVGAPVQKVARAHLESIRVTSNVE